jgi:hypothetical protein
VPVGTNAQVAASCGAQRAGSGLRGFRIDVLDADMPQTQIATTGESATMDAWTGYNAIPTGVTRLAVKFSTTLPHDPTVLSTFYHCGIHLK